MKNEKDTPSVEDEENTGVTDEQLFDAISEGIDEATPDIEPKDDDDGDTDDSSDEDDSGDDEGPDDGKDESDDDGSADADDSESDADDADADADDVDGGKEKDDGEDADNKEADEEGEVDPINDPIPESTNKKTAERIQSLIGIAKDTTQQAEQGQEILAAIEDTGADPDQYAATLAFIKLYNSDSIDERRQALTAAQGVVRELSLKLGVNIESVVNLKDHEDLAAEVEAGSLSEQRAVEIAAQRERTTMQDASNAAAKEKKDQAESADVLVAAGREQLNNLEATLNAADPAYATLRPKFLELLKPILPKTSPANWGNVAQGVYKQLKDIVGAVDDTPALKPKPKNTPLRPKGDSGGSDGKKAEVSTALEAMDAVLGGM